MRIYRAASVSVSEFISEGKGSTGTPEGFGKSEITNKCVIQHPLYSVFCNFVQQIKRI